MQYLWMFLIGMLLCNAVPHLVAGLQGQPFPTPFARPRGVGNSPPIVNVVWGFANLGIALLVVTHHSSLPVSSADVIAAFAGALAIGLFAALHFGKVQRMRQATE